MSIYMSTRDNLNIIRDFLSRNLGTYILMLVEESSCLTFHSNIYERPFTFLTFSRIRKKGFILMFCANTYAYLFFFSLFTGKHFIVADGEVNTSSGNVSV